MRRLINWGNIDKDVEITTKKIKILLYLNSCKDKEVKFTLNIRPKSQSYYWDSDAGKSQSYGFRELKRDLLRISVNYRIEYEYL